MNYRGQRHNSLVWDSWSCQFTANGTRRGHKIKNN